MSRTTRLLLLILAPFALIFGGVAAPAFAATSAPSATISGTVVDSEGRPVRGVQVFLAKGNDDLTYVGATNTLGAYRSARNVSYPTGAYHFEFDDSGLDYASASATRTLVAGSNPIAEVQLTWGSTVSGVVKAPSGAVLANIGVLMQNASADNDADYATGTSSADGSFVASPLGIGDFQVLAFNDADGTHEPFYGGTITISTPGSTTTHDILGVKVPVTTSVTGTSPSRGKATLKVTVSAAGFGLPKPGGSFVILDGSKVITKPATPASNATVTVNLSSLKKGSHSFKVKYTGGTDTIGATSGARKVTVT